MGVCCAVIVEDESEPPDLLSADWRWLGTVLIEWQFWERDKFALLGLSADAAKILNRIEGSVYEVGVDDPEDAWQEGSAVLAALSELRVKMLKLRSDSATESGLGVDAATLISGVVGDIDIALRLCEWADSRSKRVILLAI